MGMEIFTHLNSDINIVNILQHFSYRLYTQSMHLPASIYFDFITLF